MTKLVWLLAPVLGLGAMILPVLVAPPAQSYDAPLFPLLRNAQEHLGLGQLALLLLAGIALGRLSSGRPWLLGMTAVAPLPIAAFAELAADPSSHTLLPFELAFHAAYGAIVAGGILAARRFRQGRGHARRTE